MVNNYPTPRVEPKDKGGYFVFTVNEVAYHFTISYGMYMKQNMQPPVSIWKITPTCYYKNKGEMENILLGCILGPT